MKKSDAEVTEAIDLYTALGDDISYGPEDQPAEPPQQDWLPQNMSQMSTTQPSKIQYQEK